MGCMPHTFGSMPVVPAARVSIKQALRHSLPEREVGR